MKIKLNVSQYKRLLSEMRHDGKSTGLFADEEPKVVNEFGKKMKSYVNDKSEELKNSWKTWNESKLDIMYDSRFRPGSGPSGSSLLGNRKIVEIF